VARAKCEGHDGPERKRTLESGAKKRFKGILLEVAKEVPMGDYRPWALGKCKEKRDY